MRIVKFEMIWEPSRPAEFPFLLYSEGMRGFEQYRLEKVTYLVDEGRDWRDIGSDYQGVPSTNYQVYEILETPRPRTVYHYDLALEAYKGDPRSCPGI